MTATEPQPTILETARSVLAFTGDRPDWAIQLAEYVIANVREDNDEPVTVEWLRSAGFMPNDDSDTPSLSKFICEKGQHEILWMYGDLAMQIVWVWRDSSLWLETCDGSGDTLCLLELNHPTPTTRRQVRDLCRALGVELCESSAGSVDGRGTAREREEASNDSEISRNKS
jgi:hypothetical protein